MVWAGPTTCYVWDCSHAGRFLSAAEADAKEIDAQLSAHNADQLAAAAAMSSHSSPSSLGYHSPIYTASQIHLAACGADETLPRSIDGFPDDVFTACLTTPLRMALLYHNTYVLPLSTLPGETFEPRSSNYMAALWVRLSDRLKGVLWEELQAVVRCIAWQTLERKHYQMFFAGCSSDGAAAEGDTIAHGSATATATAHDSILPALVCGFILAQRILLTFNIHPQAIPPIPAANSHHLWHHWDLLCDTLFEQLPRSFEDRSNGAGMAGDTAWCDNVVPVSFIADQLNSIRITPSIPSLSSSETSPNVPTPTPNPVDLNTLPTVCQAILSSRHRMLGSTILDCILRQLDAEGLQHAINAGALDSAIFIIQEGGASVSSTTKGIWASLAQNELSLTTLIQHAKNPRNQYKPTINRLLDVFESPHTTSEQ